MRSNVGTFKAYSRLEDQMMRATMPRVSASDPVSRAIPPRAARAWVNGVLMASAFVRPLTFKIAEVANA